MTLRPDVHECTLLDTPEILDPADSQVQSDQALKKQRKHDGIIKSLPPPDPQGKHSILWIGRIPFVKDEFNDLVYSGKSCMKVCKSEIYSPRWLATLAWSKSLLNALVTFSGNTIAWNTSKAPYIGALGLLQRKLLNACCTTASCQAPTCNFHCKTREAWQTQDSLQGQHSNGLNCLTIANHIDPQCFCHACGCGCKRLLYLIR